MPPEARFIVVAAVISNDEGKILLARRPEGTHMAGLWEFPGGKVENGESFPEALLRELREELGILVEIGQPLTFAIHTEKDLEILLLFFSATIIAGRPRPLEGQEIIWVRPDELRSYQMPPADDEVVSLLVNRNEGSMVGQGPPMTTSRL